VLGAHVCEIYSDVDGIYTCDPRIVPTAKRLPQLGYDDMLELAFAGVQMLHGRAVEMAKRYNVHIVVRSSMANSPGTWIKEDTEVEKLTVSGIAIDRNVARVTVKELADVPGIAFRVFSYLAQADISVDIILQSLPQVSDETYEHNGTCDISFTVQRQDLAQTIEHLNAHQAEIGFKMLETDETLAKLSIVGAGMATNSGVASSMFEALYEAEVNIHMISTSEIKIAVLVDELQVRTAAAAVHNKFHDIFEGDLYETF